jgi:hypothetical protein
VVAEFYLKKKNYDSQVDKLEAKLEAENGRRQRDQDEHLKNEQLAFEEVARNLELKRLQFQLTYQVTHFNAQMQIYQRRSKLLADKRTLL